MTVNTPTWPTGCSYANRLIFTINPLMTSKMQPRPCHNGFNHHATSKQNPLILSDIRNREGPTNIKWVEFCVPSGPAFLIAANFLKIRSRK